MHEALSVLFPDAQYPNFQKQHRMRLSEDKDSPKLGMLGKRGK
jgi:hypothetical protein